VVVPNKFSAVIKINRREDSRPCIDVITTAKLAKVSAESKL